MISYNTIQIGLYGLFGAGFADFAVRPDWAIDLPWFVWGFAALVVVGTLGVLRVDLNASVLAVLLVLEFIAVTLYDIGAFGHPARAARSRVGALAGGAVRARCRGRSSPSASRRSSASSRVRSTARSAATRG